MGGQNGVREDRRADQDQEEAWWQWHLQNPNPLPGFSPQTSPHADLCQQYHWDRSKWTQCPHVACTAPPIWYVTFSVANIASSHVLVFYMCHVHTHAQMTEIQEISKQGVKFKSQDLGLLTWMSGTNNLQSASNQANNNYNIELFKDYLFE